MAIRNATAPLHAGFGGEIFFTVQPGIVQRAFHGVHARLFEMEKSPVNSDEGIVSVNGVEPYAATCEATMIRRLMAGIRPALRRFEVHRMIVSRTEWSQLKAHGSC